MSELIQGIYEFHNFQLDIGKGVLFRDGQPVNLQWKTFELLWALVKSDGRLVTHRELMDELWAETFVEENNLRKHISALRKALGDGENGAVFIETVPRRGYRFLPPVMLIETTGKNASNVGRYDQAAAEEALDESGDASLPPVRPAFVSRTSGIRSEEKIVTFAAAENSAQSVFDHFSGEATLDAQSKVEQKVGVEPQKSRRRRGLRRGFKALAWGFGIGFIFLILLLSLQIASMMLFGTPNNLSKDVLTTSMTVVSMLSFPIFGGWFFGIGLFLFGIARIIFALFEKENSKLNSPLFEKVTAVIITVLIASVVIPNLIASWRAAKEFRRSQISKPQN